MKSKTSNWVENVMHRRNNRKWLRYSSNIARRLVAAMESSSNMSQKDLAEKLSVKPQYISKVLSGSENLTLETISKLSDAVGVELISFPEYQYSKKFIGSSDARLNASSLTVEDLTRVITSYYSAMSKHSGCSRAVIMSTPRVVTKIVSN